MRPEPWGSGQQKWQDGPWLLGTHPSRERKGSRESLDGLGRLPYYTEDGIQMGAKRWWEMKQVHSREPHALEIGYQG